MKIEVIGSVKLKEDIIGRKYIEFKFKYKVEGSKFRKRDSITLWNHLFDGDDELKELAENLHLKIKSRLESYLKCKIGNIEYENKKEALMSKIVSDGQKLSFDIEV